MINKADLDILEELIITSYESGVTLDEAEKLAARFLHAQMQVADSLREKDLDARMRKSGLKSIRSAVYGNIISAAEKKPTESALEHSLNNDTLVSNAQEELDKAEVSRDEMERYYSIFREAHIYYRGVSKGRFE